MNDTEAILTGVIVDRTETTRGRGQYKRTHVMYDLTFEYENRGAMVAGTSDVEWMIGLLTDNLHLSDRATNHILQRGGYVAVNGRA